MENGLLSRYSVITTKNPREIVLLRGSGCKWRRCTFCDYHLDFGTDEEENYKLNEIEIKKITGKYGKLEIINSGSFTDIDAKSMNLIIEVCKEKAIKEVHFESHWMLRNEIHALRARFGQYGIDVKIKIGVETFDKEYRENILMKGINEESPPEIARDFDEVCLLFGLSGQTIHGMKEDIETGLRYFERVCVNIMVENSTKIKPDKDVITAFMEHIYPEYIDNDRVDILVENTDFGVG